MINVHRTPGAIFYIMYTIINFLKFEHFACVQFNTNVLSIDYNMLFFFIRIELRDKYLCMTSKTETCVFF